MRDKSLFLHRNGEPLPKFQFLLITGECAFYLAFALAFALVSAFSSISLSSHSLAFSSNLQLLAWNQSSCEYVVTLTVDVEDGKPAVEVDETTATACSCGAHWQ